MGFRYLRLSLEEGDKVVARVTSDGSLRTLGGQHSRVSNDGTFAVFQVDEFYGLDLISTEELLGELTSRLTPAEIMKRTGFGMTVDSLWAELRRVGGF